MMQISSWEQLITALSENATVITTNPRQCRWVKSKFNMTMQDQGLQLWSSPDVLPWSAWLPKLWEECLNKKMIESENNRLLSEQQELLLWEQIINDSTLGSGLLNVAATARQIANAWSILHEWQLPFHYDSFNYNEDSQTFFTWAKIFTSKCKKQKWLAYALLPEQLYTLVTEQKLSVPSQLVLFGFDEFTPQQSHLISAFELRGCEVTSFASPSRSNTATRKIQFNDGLSEIETAARWVRELLSQESAVKVGIVVPDLAQRRSVIERIFFNILIPDAVISTDIVLRDYFNFSLGLPLAKYPIIHDALNALALTQDKVSIEHISSVMRSPFFGLNSEYYNRALLDVYLREHGEITIDLNKAVLKKDSLLKKKFSRLCPDFTARLAEFYSQFKKIPSRQLPSQWTNTFSNALKVFGWPGERSSNSTEYQTIEAWHEILHSFALLDPFVGQMNCGEALFKLKQFSNETIFQPESQETPIQILGLLEASGLEFDHLWILSLNDSVLPFPSKPNPYIPLPLQYKYQVPHSSPKREFEYAKKLLNRLLASSGQTFVSHTSMEEDRQLRPSALIEHFPTCLAEDLPLSSIETYQRQLFNSRQLEHISGEQLIPVHSNEKLRGGTNVFKYQAECPFRAFVQLRLGVTPWPYTKIGLTPLERGNLLHESLRHAWIHLQSQQSLLSLSMPALQQIVSLSVKEAISIAAKSRPETFTSLFVAIEQERLEKLLLGWLDIEKQRAPFTVVETEAQCRITIGDIEITAKIDRIDELPDGHKIIIDYKTNSPSPGDWFGNRPSEPQLPLYAISQTAPVAAVLFAQVKYGKMQFRGLSKEENIVPKVDAFNQSKYSYGNNWINLFESWGQVLNSLATEFANGVATVTPKDFPKTCEYCHLQPVCRIHERIDPAEVSDVEGNDEE